MVLDRRFADPARTWDERFSGPDFLKTGGPGILDHLYTADMMRAAFSALELIELRDYESDLSEGTKHVGRLALLGMVARKPA